MATKTIKKRQNGKIVKHALFIFPFILNNQFLSEISDLEEANKSFEKSRCGHFKIFDFRFMLFIKNLKGTLM